MRTSIFGRFSKDRGSPEGDAQPAAVQIDATSLERVFSAPTWLRDLGLLAWILVGARNGIRWNSRRLDDEHAVEPLLDELRVREVIDRHRYSSGA